MALYASSMPTSRAARGDLPAEQIEAWAAAEGLARLGAVQVWRLAWRPRKGVGRDHEAIWSRARRLRHGLALPDRTWRARPPHSARDLIAVEYIIDFTTFVVQHDRRGLEYAQRYGWPSSILADGDAAATAT